MDKGKICLKVLRTCIATAFLAGALTFIINAVKSWNASPSVTSGTLVNVAYCPATLKMNKC